MGSDTHLPSCHHKTTKNKGKCPKWGVGATALLIMSTGKQKGLIEPSHGATGLGRNGESVRAPEAEGEVGLQIPADRKWRHQKADDEMFWRMKD